MGNSGIYALRNLSDNKVYIGQSRNLEKRKTTHFWMLRNNRHFNVHLQRAFNRGDQFEFTVLEYCVPSKCDEREIFWISQYNATKDGYNLCDGGNATVGYHFTAEGKEKISKAKRGKKQSQEVIERRTRTLKEHLQNDPEFAQAYKEKMRKMAKERGFGGYNKGVACSEEKKRLVSAKLKGRQISTEHKEKLRDLYKGEKSLSAKLTENDVINIRYRFLSGEKQIDIQKDYPVSPQTIYDIVRFRRWKHIPNTLKELEVLKNA